MPVFRGLPPPGCHCKYAYRSNRTNESVLSWRSNPRPDPVSSSPELSMSERFALHDWSSTPLGPMKDWPEALKVAYQIMISSRFPMVIWWGPELINLYNDAYAPMLGKKHPTGFARPAAEVWREIWDVVGTQTELVLKHHQSTWNEEVLLAMERYGYTEETTHGPTARSARGTSRRRVCFAPSPRRLSKSSGGAG